MESKEWEDEGNRLGGYWIARPLICSLTLHACAAIQPCGQRHWTSGSLPFLSLWQKDYEKVNRQREEIHSRVP